jgi:hypothetical protein
LAALAGGRRVFFEALSEVCDAACLDALLRARGRVPENVLVFHIVAVGRVEVDLSIVFFQRIGTAGPPRALMLLETAAWVVEGRVVTIVFDASLGVDTTVRINCAHVAHDPG